jgi:penicillin-binding protein 1A
MLRFPRLLRWLLLAGLVICLLGAGVVGAMVYAVNARLPDVQALRTIELQEPMYVYARDGELIGLFGEMRRYPVRLQQVPLRVRQAFRPPRTPIFTSTAGWIRAGSRAQCGC